MATKKKGGSGLEKLTDEQLRSLFERQMAQKQKAEQAARDWNAAMLETCTEALRRWGGGEKNG